MKKLVQAILFSFVTFFASAQSDKFVPAMEKNLGMMDAAFKNPQELLSLSNNFERIAVAEKNQWLPYYYSAFCMINYSYREQDKSKIDDITNKAELMLNKADSLSPANSEISCLKSMIASARLMVSPMERYVEFGPISERELQAAMSQDPNNPRPHYLKGVGLKYTPEQFGGGCKTAVPHFQTAMDKYASFKPASSIAPTWGKDITVQMLTECK